jgi:hypothetical protein
MPLKTSSTDLIMRSLLTVVSLLLLMPLAPVQAAEGEDLLELKNTIVNLVDALVEQGVITAEKAAAIKQEAALKAARDAAGAKATTEPAPPSETEVAEAGQKKVVRVPYVPEFVKEEIREQVRAELRKDVREDVVQIARDEKWGVKDALPEWVNKITIGGDVRLRAEGESFSDDNPDFVNLVQTGQLTAAAAQFIFDPQALNEKGFIDPNVANNLDVARNTSEERNRYLSRVRLNVRAEMAEHLEAGARITTGNIRNPVSINQTLGNTGQRHDIQLDQAYIKYDWLTFDRGPVLSMSGGRFERPWLPHATELLWDNDLQFEGGAVTLTQGFGRRPDAYKPDNAVFVTGGVFPLNEVSFSTEDRYMYGVQGGARWKFRQNIKANIGLAYFDYQNVTGRLNPVRSTGVLCTGGATCFFEDQIYNYSIPDFMQGGNTLMNIRADTTTALTTDATPYGLALASDYNILNLTGEMDLGFFDPYHVIIDFDVAKNLGYDTNDILDRVTLDPAVAAIVGGTGTALVNNAALANCTGASCLEERTLAYAVMVRVGYPRVERWGQWQLMGQYRYVERDAVLDAFTESNFHQGGTDTKGYMLAALFGVSKNVWARARYMSSDEIEDSARFNTATRSFVVDGAPYGIDRLQLDLNAQF